MISTYTQGLLICFILAKFSFQSNAECMKLASKLKNFLDGARSFRI